LHGLDDKGWAGLSGLQHPNASCSEPSWYSE
jgi:hypothetical protein